MPLKMRDNGTGDAKAESVDERLLSNSPRRRLHALPPASLFPLPSSLFPLPSFLFPLPATVSRPLLATCVASAAAAAEIIRQRSADRASIRWEHKGPSDFVSETDRAAERLITDIVRGRHADARILGEELSPTMTDRAGLVFVVDPLDGTTNF